MPESYPDFQTLIVDTLLDAVPERDTRIIDVGAGNGSFGASILAHFPNTDAIEVWRAYVEQFQLASKYRRVYVMRAQDIDDADIRDTVFVLGDVLEHLDPPEAQLLLRRLRGGAARMIVVKVPWMYEQGADHPAVVASGNVYEIHNQPDLTPEVFASRYPEMTLLSKNTRCGVYVWGLPGRFLQTASS